MLILVSVYECFYESFESSSMQSRCDIRNEPEALTRGESGEEASHYAVGLQLDFAYSGLVTLWYRGCY